MSDKYLLSFISNFLYLYKVILGGTGQNFARLIKSRVGHCMARGLHPARKGKMTVPDRFLKF